MLGTSNIGGLLCFVSLIILLQDEPSVSHFLKSKWDDFESSGLKLGKAHCQRLTRGRVIRAVVFQLTLLSGFPFYDWN